jgi:hypothetical protein
MDMCSADTKVLALSIRLSDLQNLDDENSRHTAPQTSLANKT